MQEFARKRGVRYLAQVELIELRDFRAGWKLSPLSSTKTLERLRSFYHSISGSEEL